MNSIYDLVVATFSRLEMPAPTDVWESFLVKDGFFIGHKFHCEGGYAVWARVAVRSSFMTRMGNS